MILERLIGLVARLVKNFPALYVPTGSLPRSQEANAGAHPELEESSPHPQTLLLLPLPSATRHPLLSGFAMFYVYF
jgi:hypothetical protein